MLGTLLLMVLVGSSLAKTPAEIRAALSEAQLMVVTVATERTDGFLRYERSAREFGLDDDLLVLGMDQEWLGGDMEAGTGGGQKVRLLREALEKHRDREDLVVLFTDAYDVIINADRDAILKRFFTEFEDARVVFSAEGYCWPRKELASSYPLVKSGKRYLCSGMWIGHVKEVYAILSHAELADDDDDQLYYTKIFLDAKLRSQWNIALDSNARLMQNLHGAEEDVTIELSKTGHGQASLHNVAYNTRPLIVHGNGLSKQRLNQLGNYLGKAWSLEDGCVACREGTRNLFDVKDRDLPIVLLGVTISKPTPFLEEFLQRLAEQDYPKARLVLHLHNTEERHKDTVKAFLDKHQDSYSASEVHGPEDDLSARQGMRKSLELCQADEDCEAVFAVDSEAQLTNPAALRALVAQNRPLLAPALSRPGKLWSNFWGAVSEDGFYERSDDYLDIVQGKRKGVWNVAYVTAAVLIHRAKLADLIGTKERRGAYDWNADVDEGMSFSQFCRDRGHFLLVDNLAVFGHLVDSDGYRLDRLHPDLYEIYNNRLDWELRYIHPEYQHYIQEDVGLPQPCPDVYDFPFLSPRMCKEIIEEMENFGEWSNGANNDERLAGGYENVPTRDIHMNQISYEKEWLHILQTWVRPIQEKVYWGYYHNPVHSIMNFVVRYKPEEQASLRPHHDSSTYTIDVSLNEQGKDYEGGGVRFLRYNCSVIGKPVGWSIIMPGRLTHYHEGLTTTKGTRYIAISFINP